MISRTLRSRLGAILKGLFHPFAQAVAVCEMSVQHLRGVVAVCETTMQHLRGLFTVCETTMQALHSLFGVSEMIMQALHSLFGVCDFGSHAGGASGKPFSAALRVYKPVIFHSV